MSTGSDIAIEADRPRVTRVGGALLVVGGLVAVPLWLVFTSVHGPTSFNENHITLGRDMHFWGMLLGVIPNVLVAAGLWLSRAALLRGAGGSARVGYALVLLALLVSAGIDLAFGALGPPLLLPLVAVGSLVLALAPRDPPSLERAVRTILVAIGAILAVAFVWALVPLETSDAVGGYRIFGFMVHVLGGIGWAVLGIRIARLEPGDPAPA
jgi:hypothetical protein